MKKIKVMKNPHVPKSAHYPKSKGGSPIHYLQNSEPYVSPMDEYYKRMRSDNDTALNASILSTNISMMNMNIMAAAAII